MCIKKITHRIGKLHRKKRKITQKKTENYTEKDF